MVSKEEIADGLVRLGVKRGGVVLLHSALSSLGIVEGGADTVIDAFLKILGPKGTLVVPVFGNLGIIPAVLRQRPGAIQSIHPLASVAALGPKAEDICRDHWKAETAHGPDTPFARIADLGGMVVLLGVDHDRNTTMHVAETLERMSYLTTKTRTFTTPNGKIKKSFPFFPGPHRNFIGLDLRLRDRGVVRAGKIGNALVRVMNSRALIEATRSILRNDPTAFLCGNPSCEDCRKQHKALRKDSFPEWSFTLCASSHLAGNKVAEIIDNLKRFGVGHVELDLVGGRQVSDMGEKELRVCCRQMRKSGIRISSLHTGNDSDRAENLLSLAGDMGIPSMVVPIHDSPGGLTSLAKEKGVDLLWENRGQSGEQASAFLQGLGPQGGELAFNPAAFAAIGEKPFLETFKKPLKKRIGQLYLNDGTRDGQVTPLVCGNGEIKELVSILSCKSFSGTMVLDRSLRAFGDLGAAARDFREKILPDIVCQ